MAITGNGNGTGPLRFYSHAFSVVQAFLDLQSGHSSVQPNAYGTFSYNLQCSFRTCLVSFAVRVRLYMYFIRSTLYGIVKYG